MKAPLSWIKEYTEVKADKNDLLLKIATQLGEVENVEDLSKKYNEVIIAQILEKAEHPDADKLAVYKIDTGSEKVQVVAGDKTLEVGDKVGYFAPGVKVSSTVGTDEEIIVKAINLRGVESAGMMGSERELDFGPDHSGIMRLESEAKVGQTFTQAYGLTDLVLDIENKALANRGDCFGIIGLAREISGIQGNSFDNPTWLENTTSDLKYEERVPIQVTNEAGGHCPRYTAVVMDGVEIRPSPTWLKARIIQAGVRPINNIVDITNYLMILTGQPLHAFDYDKIIAKDSKSKNMAKIVIRPAKEGETITTLDGKTVELHEGVTVIADSENPIGIAGIMGGQSTEIDDDTKRIVIECANFDRYNIRRSSMKLGLFTDAVTRFTKALDPNMCEPTILKAIEMVHELANGLTASSIQDDYKTPIKERVINLSIQRVNTHLGTELSQKEITKLLENIGYAVEKDDSESVTVTVPTFRQDILISEDVHEDIGRHYGYNNITVTLPDRTILPPKRDSFYDWKNDIRDLLSRNGMNEVLTYNFVGQKLFEKCGMNINSAYHIKNALSPELEFMRYSLLPSLIEKIGANLKNGYEEFGIFEINVGHTSEELDDEKLPLERKLLSGVISSNTEVPYYQAKVYTDLLLEGLNIKQAEYELLSDAQITSLPAWLQRIIPSFELNRSAVLYIQEKDERIYLGVVGEPTSIVADNFQYDSGVSMFELDAELLMEMREGESGYYEPSKFPSVSQDFCFQVDTSVPYEHVRREILGAVKTDNVIGSVDPRDIYQTEKGSETKQITFRVTVQNTQKTLEQKEIEKMRDTIIRKVEKKFGAKLI